MPPCGVALSVAEAEAEAVLVTVSWTVVVINEAIVLGKRKRRDGMSNLSDHRNHEWNGTGME
jgi:hypothetical protein